VFQSLWDSGRVAIQGTEVFTADAQLGRIAENALLAGCVIPPSVDIKITAATEADLCAAQKSYPSLTLELENLIAYVKASNLPPPEPEPLRVEIVNAEELAPKGHGASCGAPREWQANRSGGSQGESAQDLISRKRIDTASGIGTLDVDTTAYTPVTRTLTIAGTTSDLSANRTRTLTK